MKESANFDSLKNCEKAHRKTAGEEEKHRVNGG